MSHLKGETRKTGSVKGKSNADRRDGAPMGRAQLKAKGAPGPAIGDIARAKGAGDRGQKNTRGKT
jgi:hypothetical protein